MKKDYIRQKVRAIYEFIQENLYLNRPDMKVRGQSFNSALLFSLLTALNRGKELIIGEPGLGKTTSAEYIGSMTYRLPLDLIWASEVSGHPEQTEEKIIGRPDLGRLNQGEEVVVWSYLAQLPVKIIDEINRLPETKQSMILDGVDRGKWEYLNDVIINEEYCLFATANYQDRGTNTLIAPLIDRFDVMVESRHPGPNMALMIGMKDKYKNVLRSPVYEGKFQEILNKRQEHREKMRLIEETSNGFGEHMDKEFGVKMLSQMERKKIRDHMQELSLDLDANAFLRSVIAELCFCHKYRQKRSDEFCEEGCHYTGFSCYHIKNCISNRFPTSIRTYSQSLAWLTGDKVVGMEHIKASLPYTLAHRVLWKEDYIAQKQGDIRSDPLQIHMAKETVNEIYRRYNEQSDHIKNSLALGHQVLSGKDTCPIEGDHPLYAEIERDLEGFR
ncbi:MAG: AAA family ATPase [Thermodesulfobacteriota bacterium]|nr:AAA family ATPase [Thermodesulfobacteriota bacterium]